MDSEGFLTVPDVIIAPVDRTDASDYLPAAVKPPATQIVWTAFTPNIINRWAETLVAGVSTPHDGSVTTPGFAMADADVQGAYFRLDRIVIVRLWIKLGIATVLNSLVYDYGTLKMSGDRGNTSMTLPFPVSKGNSYQLSLLNFLPNQSAFGSIPRLAPGATEMPINVWDQMAHSTVGTPVGIHPPLWATGNPYDLQLEYETDAA